MLDDDRYVLGREGSKELRYPELGNLSREHLAFERQDQEWTVRDLGSTNGTMLNGVSIKTPQMLHSADVVKAGPLSIVFRKSIDDVRPAAAASVVFVEVPSVAQEARAEATLDRLLTGEQEFNSSGHMQALIHAGRELATNMPLEKLFELIMNLSVDAVGAS